MKAKAWFAAAAAGAALCLALPFAVFAVWDRALTARPQPLPADDPALAGLLSAEGRARRDRLLLYAAAHVFGVELSPLDLSGGWTQAAQQTLPPDTVRAALAGESAAAENAWSAAAQQAAQIAQDLRAAGLLAEDCWQAVADGWDGTVTAECYTAPGGLARLRLWDENTGFDIAWDAAGRAGVCQFVRRGAAAGRSGNAGAAGRVSRAGRAGRGVRGLADHRLVRPPARRGRDRLQPRRPALRHRQRPRRPDPDPAKPAARYGGEAGGGRRG